MSTDCGLIVKDGNTYWCYGYIKWDGQPYSRGVIFKNITEDTETDNNQKISEFDECCTEYCTREQFSTFDAAKSFLYKYNDYTYFANLDENKLYLYFKHENVFIEIDEYSQASNIYNLLEEKENDFSKTEFIKHFTNFSQNTIILFTSFWEDEYGFINNNLMETE